MPGERRPPGRLICVEGGEGAGKTTQAQMLARAIGAHLTREPGGTALGERIRELLLTPSSEKLAARSELMLVLAARAQHLAERIEPLLEEGSHVVVDRFSGSTLAYQGYGRGLPIPEVRQACDIATNGRWPDLAILLDVPAPAGLARRREPSDRFEGESDDFHERVRDGFLAEAAAEPERWVVIDGTRPAGEVAGAVLESVRGRLGLEAPAGTAS